MVFEIKARVQALAKLFDAGTEDAQGRTLTLTIILTLTLTLTIILTLTLTLTLTLNIAPPYTPA